MTSLKRFITILMLCPTVALACSGWVIGFRGDQEQFDHAAFAEYAQTQGLCWRSFGWNQPAQALDLIKHVKAPYQLYGYSRGAITVGQILQQVPVKPTSVITVGAFRTVNVNFDRFGVPYRNYFDRSGQGQTSPGIYLDVEHYRVQRVVTDMLKGNSHGRVANIGLRAELIPL